MASSISSKVTREEYKRGKAIEEQRKAGTIPAEVDPETGKDINPHIPHYISQAPWYLDVGHPTLKHQKNIGTVPQANSLNEWYDRGATIGKAANKFRKGACTNCGSISHKSIDCLERPRKTGAKYNPTNIQPDEKIQTFELDFDAKRDRWNGYNPDEQMESIREWELVDAERRRIREENAKKKLSEGVGKNKGEKEDKEEEEDSDGDSGDEDKYADSAEVTGQKYDAKTRTTVRNLRIREDTAKYLLNLDVNSAYYDPKTRSMRQNPRMNDDPTSLTYAGDNFLRYTGDAKRMTELQVFGWDAAGYHDNVHLQANPSASELLHRQYLAQKQSLSSTIKSTVLDKYGGQEYLSNEIPKELLIGQTENYVEYSQSTGKVIKGQEKAKVKSRWEEDVLFSNHTKIWGSYWENGKWGYACCHSLIKAAYCSGDAGIEAAKASLIIPVPSEQTIEKEKTIEKPSKSIATGVGKKRVGDGEILLDDDKLSAALAKERKRKQTKDDGGGKKKKYNSVEHTEITEEELEAYRVEKSRGEDPMAGYVDDE